MKVVMANGCFDLFHYGHLLHLMAARDMGEFLVVSITADSCVNKPGRPILDQEKRARMVGELKCVDEVIIVTGMRDALRRVKPDIVVKGRDYDALDPGDANYCRRHGIEIRFTDTPKFSTTAMIDEARRRSGL